MRNVNCRPSSKWKQNKLEEIKKKNWNRNDARYKNRAIVKSKNSNVLRSADLSSNCSKWKMNTIKKTVSQAAAQTMKLLGTERSWNAMCRNNWKIIKRNSRIWQGEKSKDWSKNVRSNLMNMNRSWSSSSRESFKVNNVSFNSREKARRRRLKFKSWRLTRCMRNSLQSTRERYSKNLKENAEVSRKKKERSNKTSNRPSTGCRLGLIKKIV